MIKTDSAERMRITSSGQVGIGTSSPIARLHVVGGDALINGIYVGRGGGTGEGNVVVGTGFRTNTDGGSNTVVGEGAMNVNISGIDNTAIGWSALANSTGSRNVAIGRTALGDNTSGGGNVAVGWGALKNTGSSSWNTAIGHQAGITFTTGENNTFLGMWTGVGFVSGSNNTFLGSNSSTGLVSGNSNTIIGWVSTLPSVLNNNIIISDGSGNRRINVDNVGRVGLGVISPAKKLHVGGSKDSSDVRFEALAYSSTNTTPIGSYGLLIADSLGNIHRRSVDSTVSTTSWSLSGNSSIDSSLKFLGTIGSFPIIIKTNNIERLRVTSSGLLGIGTTNPQANLHVNGSTRIGTNGTNISQVIKMSYNVDPSNIAPGNKIDIDIPVTNANQGSVVSVSPSADLETGIVIAFARVYQTGGVRLRLFNATASSIDPNPITFDVVVIQ